MEEYIQKVYTFPSRVDLVIYPLPIFMELNSVVETVHLLNLTEMNETQGERLETTKRVLAISRLP